MEIFWASMTSVIAGAAFGVGVWWEVKKPCASKNPFMNPRKVAKLRRRIKRRRKLGLPFDAPQYGLLQSCLFGGVAWLITVLLMFGLFGVWPRHTVAILNLIAVFIGGALRFISHGRSDNWRFIDQLGKLIGYYGAFVTLMMFAGNN